MQNRNKRFETARVTLLRLPRRLKRALSVGADIVACLATFVVAYVVIRMGLPDLPLTATAFVVISVMVLPFSYFVGLYKSIIRFVSVDQFVVATKVSVFAALLLGGVVAAADGISDGLRVALFCIPALTAWFAGSRFGARLVLNKRVRSREPVIIYGAGQAGVRLAASLSSTSRFFPVAFVDDSPTVTSISIEGIDVYPPSRIQELISKSNAARVLIAIPSASRRAKKRIIDRLEPLAVRVQTIPDIGDIIAGNARVDDIRDVAVEDLLGRDAVPPRVELLEQENKGLVVLVTGAGGSIGSELCRSVLSLQPDTLLLFERSEIALYNIERSLREEQPAESKTRIVALLGCIQDKERLIDVMTEFGVQTVYHAAAYKHVPIVEHNVIEGIRNNVFGTLSAAAAALECGVKTFVLVSTDKAVSPTNVMGASKRLAEIVLQRFAAVQEETTFCMVRFGNVLASSGSVVPLFRDQIRSGGPVTVTHPDITRYFMTIPEAAQLVVQAGALATGGDVFVLDMGEPVKIVDLASKMIHLMGLQVSSDTNPDGDIEIVFSGLRPAEKLYEELLIGSNVSGTSHPRILRASEASLEGHELDEVLAELRSAMESRNLKQIRQTLQAAVEGYRPTGGIEDHLYRESVSSSADQKITDLSRYR